MPLRGSLSDRIRTEREAGRPAAQAAAIAYHSMGEEREPKPDTEDRADERQERDEEVRREAIRRMGQ